MTPLYFEVHVPAATAGQLRRRGVDLPTVQEDGAVELDDPDLLTRSTLSGRVLSAQDIRFKALAEDWQRAARPFAGLIFGHQLHGSIGQYVRDLELIAHTTEPAKWVGRVEKLPLV